MMHNIANTVVQNLKQKHNNKTFWLIMLRQPIFLISLIITQVAWSQGAKPKQSTASTNVFIIDTAFNIPQLQRTRRIWIYLPSGYETSKKKYPVLYLQDGQNVFSLMFRNRQADKSRFFLFALNVAYRKRYQ